MVDSTITMTVPDYSREGVVFNITGKVSPGVARPVRLQVKRNGVWELLDAGTSDASGNYSFAQSLSSVTWYRVVAPRFVNNAGTEYLVATSPEENVGCLLFWDTFDGTQLSDAWTLRGNTYTDSRTKSRADWRAVEVKDSKLYLKVIKDPDNPGKYLTGHVGTQKQFDFTNGHAQAKVKFHRYKGAHSAFWLQGGYGPNGAEIDIVEFFGEGVRNFVHHTIWEDVNQDGVLEETTDKTEDVAVIGTDRWWNSYHEIALNWQDGKYVFRIDDIVVARFTMPTATDPAFVCLSIMCNDWEYPDMQNPDNGGYVMAVEWVRVWC